ncbi:hypothetical protein SAMN05421823_105243 [Catalinimonas alkaloidigena]|uniref:Uncharacterized protein n=1 Tax=Catalinimonas alkaloidigena TaxID=1075417 RepID=A0A1G9J8X2_9BACT|nr:hypothetical protein [Catalinimonas alkaloidigena]SDL33999.1 hypothetical protein SAMN05421823_105243 [Catalinimonas alkaloidigena]
METFKLTHYGTVQGLRLAGFTLLMILFPIVQVASLLTFHGVNLMISQWVQLPLVSSTPLLLGVFGALSVSLMLVWLIRSYRTAATKPSNSWFLLVGMAHFFLLTPVLFFMITEFSAYVEGAPINSDDLLYSSPLVSLLLIGFGISFDLVRRRPAMAS